LTITEVPSTNFTATFCHGESDVIFFIKNGLDYIMGDFFTNAFGHPDRVSRFQGGQKSICQCIDHYFEPIFCDEICVFLGKPVL
jgi:hypothetical protein